MQIKKQKNVGADSISAQKRNNGITLIALIITIIVMLILVGVSIQVALNTGLFDSAGKATGDWNAEQEREQELASGKVTIGNKTYNSIDEYKESLVAENEADKVIETPQTYYKSFEAGDNITVYLVENETATQANGETTYDMLFTGTGEMEDVSLWIDKVCNIEQVGPDEYEWIMLENVKISYGITNITAEAFRQCDSLSTVTYSGTQSQWDSINIGENNECLINAKNQ